MKNFFANEEKQELNIIGTPDLVQTHRDFRNTHIINLDTDIGPPNEYRQAFSLLREASLEDAIVLMINTDGGHVSTVVQFFNHLLKTQATTFAEVYCAYSAGSIIALSCDNINVGRYGSMMIHALSAGALGKAHELDGKVKFISQFNDRIIKELYTDFLTDKEIETIIAGKDIWLMENDINKRLKGWKSVRLRMYEKDQEKNHKRKE